MKRAVRIVSPTALVLAAALCGCDALPGRPTAADRYVPPTEVADFAALYALHCAGCHGADGTLGPARPLRDPLYLRVAGDAALRDAIARGVAGTAMSPFLASEGGTLTEAQIDALVAGMLETWGGAAGEGPFPAYSAAGSLAAGYLPGSAERGARAYATHCARCHGPDGRGSDAGGSVVDGAYLGLVSDQGLRSAVIAGRTDLGMPDYRGGPAARAMLPQEISDVVAWLAAQRPAFPGQPYPAADEPGARRRAEAENDR